MILPRREFLKLLGITAAASGVGACNWFVPDRRVELALRGPGLESEALSICGLCRAGCGVSVRLVDGLPVGLRGNPRHPLNRGGLCPVGLSGLEVLYSPERVRGPMKRAGSGALEATTWEEAVTDISATLARLRDANAAHRIAFLVDTPGQLMRELAFRFAESLGTPNCAVPAAEALPYKLTQGVDRVPGFDLARADLVLAFGFDLFEEGPAPLQAIAALVGSRDEARRARLIHVGTRMSPGTTKASQRLLIRPASHGALALGIAHVLVREGRYDERFVRDHTVGFDDWTDAGGRRHTGFRRLLLEQYYPDRVAKICGCEARHVVQAARRFASASAPVALAGGDELRGSNYTWNVMAVHSLNALVGAFDRPGGVVVPAPIPFTPLGSIPAAADANQNQVFLADDGGALAVDPIHALAEKVLDGSRQIDVLFILNSNPVYESPAGERLQQAMGKIPLTVAVTPFCDETATHATYVLPSHHYLESWQEATTPATVAFNVLGLAQPVVEPLFNTRHPGDIMLALAQHLGGDVQRAMPWEQHTDYLKDRLRGLFNSGQGTIISNSFEGSWVQFLEERGWRFLQYASFDKFWDDLVQKAGWWNPALLADKRSPLFPTPSGRFEFRCETLYGRHADVQADGEVGLVHYETPIEVGEGELTLVPFTPITARGTLGCYSPMILEMFGHHVFTGWETWVELGVEDANERELQDGDHVTVESSRGMIEAVVRVSHAAQPGVVHMPIGLGHGASTFYGSNGSNPNAILELVPDPISGTLSKTATRVRLGLVRRRKHGGPAPHEGEHA